MNPIDKTIHNLRPRLRDMAPQTYWISLAFAGFNIVVGYAVFNHIILYRLQLLGALSLSVWGLIFLAHGLAMLFSLGFNNWKLTRSLHMIGIALKGTWWFEALAAWVAGQSPFPWFVWSFLTVIQIIVYIYFTPRLGHGK